VKPLTELTNAVVSALARLHGEAIVAHNLAAIGAPIEQVRESVALLDLAALAEAVTALQIAMDPTVVCPACGDRHDVVQYRGMAVCACPNLKHDEAYMLSSEYAVPLGEVEDELESASRATGIPVPKAVRS
jgi:hypothetical protein